ncbi:sensor histidine kinase [Cellulomonas sp. KRMCY2]|uniref:sensor histidine kinase n=1 Tax=Cellulomonas sp. KRMCY2 TaxID=1304865 RepID=UPI00045E6F4C|nr:sensor histidine kinase [Cellulomonas sp. KRMCY2]
MTQEPRTTADLAAGAARSGLSSRAAPAGLPLTLATLVLMVTAVVYREGGATFPGTALLVFTVAAWLPLTVRTRWPLPALLATVLVEATQLALQPTLVPGWETPIPMAAFQPIPVATVVAAFTVARRLPRRRAWLAGAAAAVVLPAVALVVNHEQVWTFMSTCLTMFNLVLGGTAVGALAAGRQDRLGREVSEREEQTQRAVEAERLHIARELHDVLAHHLTLVNAQAAVAEYLVRTDPEAAATALHGLAEHTRSALDEVRATVGLLRQPNEADDAVRTPSPRLEHLPELVDAVRSAGSQVDVAVSGEPRALTARGDLAAYRVVQEALTNAAKHAPGALIEVNLDWDSDQLRIRVRNGASPDPRRRSPSTGPGHGLIGMRERTHAAGGTWSTAVLRGGGFAVRVTLPTADAPAPTLTETP